MAASFRTRCAGILRKCLGEGRADAKAEEFEEHVRVCPLDEKVFTRSTTNKKIAVLLGLNYRGSSSALRGCINDAENMFRLLSEHYGYTQFVVMTDDTYFKPTKRNILRAIDWLVRKSDAGDSVFFHYSGHGTSVREDDYSGPDREKDGKDEALVALDYLTGGIIRDDELYAKLVKTVKPGVHLTSIIDACHSGTMLDMPYSYVGVGNGEVGFQTNELVEVIECEGIFLSGCHDKQTSADAPGAGNTYYGALTHNFIKICTENDFKDMSIETLVRRLHRYLDAGRFTQRPQISSTQPLDLSAPFGMNQSFEQASRSIAL